MKKEQVKKQNKVVETSDGPKEVPTKKVIDPESMKKPIDPIDLKKIDGLQQAVILEDGSAQLLSSILNEKDFWVTTGKIKRTILTHGAIQKIADRAGLSKVVGYKILTQPDAMNNYQYTIEATVCSLKNKDICATELGEANRNNLGAKGRSNPANMAQKRAYDRAVLRILGITNLLSEEELSDNEDENQMEKLSPEDNKAIAPIINQLLLAKTKEQLAMFNSKMKESAKSLNPAQLEYLRKLYKKSAAEIIKTKF